jgi:hypothetical protein
MQTLQVKQFLIFFSINAAKCLKNNLITSPLRTWGAGLELNGLLLDGGLSA